MSLTSNDALELLIEAPTPAAAAALPVDRIAEVLAAHRRRDPAGRAATIAAALRTEHLRVSGTVAGAYAAGVSAQARLILALNEQIKVMEERVRTHFRAHPAAEIYLSIPGIGEITGARVLAEFGDDPTRYHDAKSRKDYAGTSPITRASGKTRIVAARFVRNKRLADSLEAQSFSSLKASPGARAYYDVQPARGINHHAALRQVGNRYVGILHGCLKAGKPYDEATAWPQHHPKRAAA